jgi:hypothetical protein
VKAVEAKGERVSVRCGRLDGSLVQNKDSVVNCVLTGMSTKSLSKQGKLRGEITFPHSLLGMGPTYSAAGRMPQNITLRSRAVATLHTQQTDME